MPRKLLTPKQQREKEAKHLRYMANRPHRLTKIRIWQLANPDKVKRYYATGRKRNKEKRPWINSFTSVRSNAHDHNIPFDLTLDWGDSTYTGVCTLTGLKFAPSNLVPNSFSPSIDKIDPDLGYLQSNCRFVLFAINTFKGIGTDNTMYDIAKALIDNKP